MPFIKPSRPQYKPELDLKEEGQFEAFVRDVRFGLANRSYPDGKPNLAIEFEIDDAEVPHLRGKLVSIICTESVYRDPVTKQESKLVTHARMMGVKNPEQGFAPEDFVGKRFRIQVEQQEDGRCFVRLAMPQRATRPAANGTHGETPAPPTGGAEGDVPF